MAKRQRKYEKTDSLLSEGIPDKEEDRVIP
jgi:hypothetical protein